MWPDSVPTQNAATTQQEKRILNGLLRAEDVALYKDFGRNGFRNSDSKSALIMVVIGEEYLALHGELVIFGSACGLSRSSTTHIKVVARSTRIRANVTGSHTVPSMLHAVALPKMEPVKHHVEPKIRCLTATAM